MSLETASDGAPAVPIDSPQLHRLPPLLRQAWYGLNQAFRRRIAPHGVTPDQFTALRWLQESESQGLTQRELAEVMSSDPNTVASLVERMETAGLIQRHPDAADRRAKRIHLQAQGRITYRRVRDIAVDLQEEILQELAESQRAPFLENLKRVAEACRNAAAHSPKGPVVKKAKPTTPPTVAS